jgi:hypothetical protein
VADFIAAESAKPTNRFLKIKWIEGNDLNGDGALDLICAGFGAYGGSSFGRYLLAQPDGSYVDASEKLDLPLTGTPVLAQDFNGDGVPDLIVVGQGLYLSGHGKFALSSGPLSDFVQKPGPYLHQVNAVDFDNDRDTDLVVCNPRGRATEIYEQTASGEFALVKQIPSWDGDPVALCDINNDGLMDVCVGAGDEVKVMLNETPNPGRYTNVYPKMPSPNPYAVGAKVEVFQAGKMGGGNKAVFTEMAHSDGTPVHVGLGDWQDFDLRVTFPGGKVVERKKIAARAKLEVSAL